MSFSVAGKTAIITGAANGIGLAVARRFANAGANIIMADMDEEQLHKNAENLPNGQDNIRVFTGDLRKKLCQANLLSATIDAFGKVDILVNASRQFATTPPLESDDASLDTLLLQNCYNALHLSQLIAKRMMKQTQNSENEHAGSIVNLSSIAAARIHKDLMGYCVSTAALEQITRNLAVALAPEGIRVNAVAFGSVMSKSLQDTLKGNPNLRQEMIDLTPLGAIAAPDAVASTVQFLASQAAHFITGQILTVDGGRTLLDPISTPAH